MLLRVTDIQPAVTRTLADVKDQVRDKLARTKAEAQLQTLLDQVEDHRLAGKSLKEIADLMKLEFIEIPATDRFNKTPEGKPATTLEDGMALLGAAFQSQVGLENEVLELRNGGYAWFDVLGVTEEKQKPFDDGEGRGQNARRSPMSARVSSPSSPTSSWSAPTRARPWRRSPRKPATSRSRPRRRSRARPSRRASPRTPSPAPSRWPRAKPARRSPPTARSRTVFKVTEITPAPAPTKEQRERISKDLQNELTDEVLNEYVVALQKRLGTHINEAEFKKATGATETQ